MTDQQLDAEKSPERRSTRAVAWFLGGLVVGAVVVALLWWQNGGPGPGPTESAGPVPAIRQARDDLFVLTIGSARSQYAVDEPIVIETTLRYVGHAGQTTVTSSGSGLVVFRIEQLDGPVDALGGRDSDCHRFHYRRGAIEQVQFQKSGGFSSDSPMAGFWRAFYADPQLRLPAGHYRITAQADYGPPACGEGTTLEASILIAVE